LIHSVDGRTDSHLATTQDDQNYLQSNNSGKNPYPVMDSDINDFAQVKEMKSVSIYLGSVENKLVFSSKMQQTGLFIFKKQRCIVLTETNILLFTKYFELRFREKITDLKALTISLLIDSTNLVFHYQSMPDEEYFI
jgi:hypothetical protein